METVGRLCRRPARHFRSAPSAADQRGPERGPRAVAAADAATTRRRDCARRTRQPGFQPGQDRRVTAATPPG